MGFIGKAIDYPFKLNREQGPEVMWNKFFGEGEPDPAVLSKKARAFLKMTKAIKEQKAKQGFSSTLFAGAYKPPKELQTLFSQDASKLSTILGG